ncbi:hypothetical protein D0864_07862 [Hortaea werneckii]|uniref:Myb-like domain-containing protein n=1 Tax=Hortaea werneckii TaxID=91943 RepID=A0A3M7F337_HORWE|nr:hypothetical protein KC338_g3038 [Hortaea werneckii]KAI7670990.1 hypothetical protein KC319_g5707 [Hortaea werneckii]KAI7695433.1 hypothetical protein KC322_g10094 [Hortaea werneckii]RMY83268.1 hypothetical protein D0864_07862 [Hortaea werneckii]
MSERFTEHDRKILSIWKNNCKAQWDNIATAGGYPHRKAAQKAVRRVTKKLGLPPRTTGGPAPEPQELPPPTTGGSASRPQRGLHTTRSNKGGPKSDASAGRVKTPKKGEPRKGRESGQGLNREGEGARIGEGTGEGTGEDTGEEGTGEEGTGEGVDQRVGQGSDRFVKGRPYNERIDRDYRPRVGELLGDSESSDGGDDDSEDEMEILNPLTHAIPIPNPLVSAAITKLTPLFVNQSLPITPRLPPSFDPSLTNTLCPPGPSTTFPLPLSVTVTCVKAPNTESTTDPTNPIKLTNAAVRASIVIPSTPSPPEQNLNAKTAVTVKRHDPSAPYPNPSIVTPPFVPRATFRQGAVIRNGLPLARIPSSDENVSAATAAYCTSTPIGNTLSRFGTEGPAASGKCEEIYGPFAFRRIHVCATISTQATPEFASTCTALRGPSPPAPPVDDVVSVCLALCPIRVTRVPSRKKSISSQKKAG